MSLGQELPLFWTLPFAGFLLCIAFLPLALPHFWEKNRNKAILAALFGLPVAIFVGMKDIHALEHVVLEYFSFLTLLTALFVISGGVLLKGDIEATPRTNTLFLLTGALLSNLIGTTGASVLLIRALLKTNRERKNTIHIPVFFIFLVSNIGGLLLPIGDPPLFLGYLEGVPFFWTLKLFPIWLTALGLVLGIFFVIDTLAYRRESPESILWDKTAIEPLKLAGGLNFVWLGVVLFSAVFLQTPMREAAMILAAVASWFTTDKDLHSRNDFSFHPIAEVAILFAGIFGAMIPCLEILKARGGELGVTQPWHFFWASGILSSFLDNAPTYLTYLSLGQGVTQALGLPPDIAVRGGAITAKYLMAISAGSVFMGANTYIGNAPNFMVKSMADHAQFKTPSFVGYMLWSGAILIPTFILITLIFFR